MSLREAGDMRPEYVKKLMEFAALLAKSATQPVGLGLQVFWADHTMTCVKKTEAGFNSFAAAGLYLKIANIECRDSTEEEI